MGGARRPPILPAVRHRLPVHVLLLIAALFSARMLLAAHDVQHAALGAAESELCQVCASGHGPAAPAPAVAGLVLPPPAQVLAIPPPAAAPRAVATPFYRSRAPPTVLA